MNDSTGYRVYLDHLTSSPCLPGAVETVTKTLSGCTGSLRSSNVCGRTAALILDGSRDELGKMTGAEHVHFTSCGSEANLASVLSVGRTVLREGRGHVISSRLEHYSVNTALRTLEEEGAVLHWLDTGPDGRIDTGQLEKLMGADTGLVTVQHSNRITGIVQPVEEIASLTGGHGAHFHSDCCAAAGRVKLDLREAGIDTASISGNLIGGGPGAGAILCSSLPGDFPSRYPGVVNSVNIPAVAGMMQAIGETRLGIDARARMVNDLRIALLEGLDKRGVQFDLVGGDAVRLPGAGLLRLREEVPPVFHAVLEKEGIVLPCPRSSARLACLREMGQDTTDPERFVGFCLSPSNSIVDVEYFLRVVTESAA